MIWRRSIGATILLLLLFRIVCETIAASAFRVSKLKKKGWNGIEKYVCTCLASYKIIYASASDQPLRLLDCIFVNLFLYLKKYLILHEIKLNVFFCSPFL